MLALTPLTNLLDGYKPLCLGLIYQLMPAKLNLLQHIWMECRRKLVEYMQFYLRVMHNSIVRVSIVLVMKAGFGQKGSVIDSVSIVLEQFSQNSPDILHHRHK